MEVRNRVALVAFLSYPWNSFVEPFQHASQVKTLGFQNLTDLSDLTYRTSTQFKQKNLHYVSGNRSL